jgi:hypothetical protein
VRSASSKGKAYAVTPGGCECPDAPLVEGRCKHQLAVWIWRKARAAIEQHAGNLPEGPQDQPAPLEASVNGTATTAAGIGESPQANYLKATPEPMPEPMQVADLPAAEPTPAPMPSTQSIPAWALVELHGRQFVTFGGLLAMAHERGLLSLTAEFTAVSAELALAHAVATFTDGRTFAESGDATPGNVNAKVRAHYPRMALTRAKAITLRDALNISMVAVEELEA